VSSPQQPGSAPRANATSWDSLKHYGQLLERVVLAALPPEELRRLRGPALRKTDRPRDPHPLHNSSEVARILLLPDVDPADPTVALLVRGRTGTRPGGAPVARPPLVILVDALRRG
jgi:hypothetical protein